MDMQIICKKIILPFCAAYEKARQIFNRSIQRYPFTIVYCETEEEVRQVVSYAAWRRQKLCVRSGGHNYEGFCIADKRVVIDTSLFKSISICETTGTVRIGSGVSNGELYDFLSRYGYPFAGGTCPTVHAVGLTQGGGWGHSARMFGLTCDRLVEAELVDAGGNLITANEKSHPDLFWALRGGGGGNFGVITALRYRLLPQISHVTYVDIQYSGVDENSAVHFFRIWQDWVKEKEVRFTPNSRIFHSQQEELGIFLRGFFYGTAEEAQEAVRPFLMVRGAKATFRYVTFLEATQIDGSVYPESEKFRFAGRFAYRSYSDRQIKSIIGLIKRRAQGAVYASVALYAMGGRVRELRPRKTAFYYRNANYIIGVETVWETWDAAPASLKWLHSRFCFLRPLTVGSYINFPYRGTNHYMRAYYGENAGRLMRVKGRYDPCNLFCFAQSIPPAGAGKR